MKERETFGWLGDITFLCRFFYYKRFFIRQSDINVDVVDVRCNKLFGGVAAHRLQTTS